MEKSSTNNLVTISFQAEKNGHIIPKLHYKYYKYLEKLEVKFLFSVSFLYAFVSIYELQFHSTIFF